MLYWVGCAASFDERARLAAESTAKLLQAAGVDSPSSGRAESCTGDPARRMGNEYVFQAFAERNVATLNESGVTKIVARAARTASTRSRTSTPTSADATRSFATGLLAELVREGRLAPTAGEGSITYHDSCYLARHTTCAATRGSSSRRSASPVEMGGAASRTSAAAPAARMWLEERGGAINGSACARPAETGAETLAVACPFCTVMLDDGVRASGRELRVVDVATLLAESLDGGA